MREAPYNRLKRIANDYIYELKNKRTRSMFWVKSEPLNGWASDLYQRTIAAQQLGNEVIVRADDDGIYFEYRTKTDGLTVPYELRY